MALPRPALPSAIQIPILRPIALVAASDPRARNGGAYLTGRVEAGLLDYPEISSYAWYGGAIWATINRGRKPLRGVHLDFGASNDRRPT